MHGIGITELVMCIKREEKKKKLKINPVTEVVFLASVKHICLFPDLDNF